MTRKEQNKILNDKVEANNAQYNLDRMNAEISAYSSGDLPKYEYLTKKDLNYKPNAFEQAKFEYSPLGKVFIDGLDKSDKKEGLLKRLQNIEDKSNNQLLALRDINRPAIKGRNNGGNESSDNDDSDDYKAIQDFKKELINKGILHKDGSKKFDHIINKWKKTRDKNIVCINNESKLDIRKFDIYGLFYEYLTKNINYKEIRIPGEYYAKPLNNTNLSSMKDEEGYEEKAGEADSDYMKGNNDNELKLIKNFITKINNGKINNKDRAASEFRKLKQKVTNDRLKQDLIKDLEKSLFENNLENIERIWSK